MMLCFVKTWASCMFYLNVFVWYVHGSHFTVAAINSLYVALGSPALEGWKAEGGDPCSDQWEGVSCVFSNITALYVPSHFLKLLLIWLFSLVLCFIFLNKKKKVWCFIWCFLSCFIDEGECDHLGRCSLKFVFGLTDN